MRRGDAKARQLGAGDTIKVGKKEYKLSPVAAMQLAELEREALRDYKNEVLQTYHDSLHFLSNGQAEGLMLQKIDEVSRWDQSDLPQKEVYSAAYVPINEKVKKWIKEKFDREITTDAAARAILSLALDSGQITPNQVKKMTGEPPMRGRVRYDSWWVTATRAGQISFISSSIGANHSELSKEDVEKWHLTKIIEAARTVERITAASLGNG